MKKYLTLFILLLTTIVAKAQNKTRDTTIYSAVEVPAEFPGGTTELFKFIGANIIYPDSAKAANVQGKVIVSFVVEKEGDLSNIHVLKGLRPDINAEAIRVMKLSPKWKPGAQNSVPVREQFSFPIFFTIKKDTTAPAEVFTPVEQTAEFPGGIEKFYAYLMKNLRKPGGGVNGKVFVTFVIEKDGSLTDVKVMRGLSPEADAEAIRLIKASPKWKPGMQNNAPVRIQYTVPINFN